MQYSKSILLLLFGLFLFSACTKEEEPDSTTTTDPLIGTWLLIASTGDLQTTDDMGNPETVDTYALLSACEKDNTLEFTMGEEVFIYKNTLCDPEERPDHDGIWRYENNNTQLRISGSEFSVLFGEDAVRLDIISLTQEELKFIVKRSIGGMDVLDELTWEKQ